MEKEESVKHTIAEKKKNLIERINNPQKKEKAVITRTTGFLFWESTETETILEDEDIKSFEKEL